MYVKLFGGPFDGRKENVMDGCDQLRLREPQEEDENPNNIFHIYKRSKSDPQYFVYEDTES
jgi:hypothetical protein